MSTIEVLPEPEYRQHPEFIGLYCGPLTMLFYRSLGLTNRQIVDILGLPPREVGAHFGVLSRTFGAGTPYATYRAYKLGVIPITAERDTPPALSPVCTQVLRYIAAGYPAAEIVTETGLKRGLVNLALDTLHNDLQVPTPHAGRGEDALVRGAFLAGVYRPDVPPDVV